MIRQIDAEKIIDVIDVEPRKWLGVILHHTAHPDQSEANGRLMGKKIDHYHRVHRGFRELGYHILINVNGIVEIGTRWPQQTSGAHTLARIKNPDLRNPGTIYTGVHKETPSGNKIRWRRMAGSDKVGKCKVFLNSNTIGISLVGNFDYEIPSIHQVESFITIWRKLSDFFKFDPEQLRFHREYAYKSCPGKNLKLQQIQLALEYLESNPRMSARKAAEIALHGARA